MADTLDSRPHTFSIKLWPPSLPTRQALIERMTNNLSSKTIFTDKFGSLTKDQAMENAKRIEDVAFSTANLQFEREPDGDGGSAVQLYAKECSKMILEVLKKGPVCKAEQVSSASPCKETVFDISKDKRAFIEAEEAEELLKPLKEPGNVYTKICFSNRSFGLGAARVAEPILASLKDQLKVVDLSDFVAGRPEVEALEVMNIFSSALDGSVLSSLNLSDNALGEKGVRAFGTLLKSLSSLEELYLMNDGISKEAAQAVSELIPSTEKLRVLHFHNNMTGDEGAVAISEVVKRSPLLENFRCSSTRVGEGGGIALSEALENCTLMEKLDLRDNMFGTEAGVSLSKTLSRFEHLAEVYLSYLNLEDEGAIAIANALKDSAAPIEVLEMAGNDITVEAASAIAACVAAKQDLNKLNLSENELKDEGCVQIAKSVEEEHLKLQYIDMSNNYIRRAGARALAQVVIKKEGFKLLNIDGNIISEEGIEEVKEILKKTPEVLGALDENDPDGEEEGARPFLFASLIIFSSIESNHGATEVSLFTNLENSLEVTAKPTRVGVVWEAGKDIVRITWMLKSSAKVNDDAAFKTVEVKLCYAPISQVDRPWRKTHNELSRDRSCPHKIVSKPYDKIPQSLNWTIDRETPTGTYFIRAYGTDVNGYEVAYGQSSDAEKTTNLFSVEGISGRHTSLDIASICFSVFSFGSLLVFLVKEKRKAKLQQRK